MKKLLASLLALSPALALAATSHWSVDPSHSQVGFAVKHLVISNVRGEFTKYQGQVALDEADVAKSTVEASIDVSSISTKNADRDAHLKSPDFFDAARYPAMTFKSTKVRKAGPDKLEVTGDLTLHGVTRPVVLDVATTPEVKGMYGETRRGFAATTKISRKEFGLTWNKAVEAGPAVGDEVAIALDLEAVKDQPKTAAK
ncbi:YceI family protein [Anaeromyxobacter diazotrophicus]|uniref:Polyisoprenoid-binding protein n=1 Tax=Anaeromyxobacter diazotrophicus TaxID=2590199 RepID=A0A7I9VHY7_9BACT|nr:YceI family protein [Anaeromyxobacter diazotrophicus]GEJ56004.1 polyisoprenoid-binding protein [Anaeromyxobacter diazotrophicus]